MRYKFLCMGVLAIVLLLGGCSFEFATPDSLITPPLSNQEAVQQRQIITDFLDYEEVLVTPAGTTAAQAYVFQDLDDDGEDEIIAFYSNKESNFILGFLILDYQENRWVLLHKVVAYGTNVDYFEVADLDQDGQKEILFGVKTGFGSTKELYLYSTDGTELLELTKDERVSYDEILLAENREDVPILITAQTDTTLLVGNTTFMVYALSLGELLMTYEESFDGYCSALQFAAADRETNGIFAAMRHNHFTNILLLTETEDGFTKQVEAPLPYDYEDVQNITMFQDINGDGIMEVCSLWVPEENNTSKSYHDYIQVWLRWDGASSLRAVQAVLNGKNEGYEFSLPIEWLDAMEYGFRSDGSISWIDFYGSNEELEGEGARLLFSIAALDQLQWKEKEDQDKYIVLGNNPGKKKIYIAEIRSEQFGAYMIDASRLISCLKIDGGT